jgi:hypothetical protein
MRYVAILLLLSAACSSPESQAPRVSKEPISVRGWITDVEGPSNAPYRTTETEIARKMQLFQGTSVWVENAPYISGGVAENGSFLLLDVPPGTTTITFTAPGAPAAKLVLQKIPGNADVFIPGLLLRRDSVALTDPNGVHVRMAAHIDKPSPSGATASVAGVSIPIVNTPISAMSDRHDFPNPPGSWKPLTVVR